MILELISPRRLKRELNKVIKNLEKGNPDIYIVSRKGKRVAYVMAPDLFMDWLHRVDHADSDEAIRALREQRSAPTKAP
ncbi:hypothetical protein GCM10027567_13620 [Spongiibacter taiwanensis]